MLDVNGQVILRRAIQFSEGTADFADPAEGARLASLMGRGILSVLENRETSKYIRYVLVAAHASSDSTAQKNLELSMRRAHTIVEGMRGDRPSYFPDDGVVGGDQCVGAKVLAGAFGESRPVPGTSCSEAPEDEPDCSRNRRVSIEIIPKKATASQDLPGCP